MLVLQIPGIFEAGYHTRFRLVGCRFNPVQFFSCRCATNDYH